MVRGNAEQGFERDVPIEAAVVAEDELLEIGVDVLSTQAVIGARLQRFMSAKTR